MRTLLSISLCLAVLPVSDLRAAAGSPEPPFRYYSVSDGLTQSQVYDIEQDRAGYLWFTTARGLNRYNGREFDNYTITDGLPTNILTALHVDSDNNVWVGDARGGVSLIRGGRVEAALQPIGSVSTPITDIESVGGQIFAVAEGHGVLRVVADGEDYRLQVFSAQVLNAHNIVIADSVPWLVAEAGLFRMSLDAPPTLELKMAGVKQAHASSDGRLWLADDRNRIGVWEQDEFAVHASVRAEQQVQSIATEHGGRVWVATESEVYSFVVTAASMKLRRFSSIARIRSGYPATHA